MDSFRREHLQNIRTIFQEKTGVELTAKKRSARPVRAAVVLAAVLACCLTVTVCADRLFSPLSGDDLGFQTYYEGDGVVSVQVENRSHVDLVFQPDLKLMRWNTGQEVESQSGDVVFSGTRIPANSTGTMTIDLSEAYDVTMLEEPLEDDHYYFVLTNHNFIFGHDWMCSVTFAEAEEETTQPESRSPVVSQVPEGVIGSLRFYFETVTDDLEERRELEAAYEQACRELFAQVDGTVVPSVSPLELLVDDPAPGVIFDPEVPAETQYQLVGQHHFSMGVDRKRLAGPGETALTLSAGLPLTKYQDAWTDLPLFYIFTYEKEAVRAGNYAFIRGQLYTFDQLTPYQVYEDDQYVCYEVSELVYTDLMAYAEDFVQRNGTIRFDEAAQTRLENICAYYKEYLGELFYYR